jgi:hypothetical protein
MSQQLSSAEQDLAAKILEHSPRHHITADDLRGLVRLSAVLVAARSAYAAAFAAPSLSADVEVLGRRVVEAQKALLGALDRMP